MLVRIFNSNEFSAIEQKGVGREKENLMMIGRANIMNVVFPSKGQSEIWKETLSDWSSTGKSMPSFEIFCAAV